MIKFFQKLKAKKGFTLVELIVVIAIIGVLAAILVPTMLGYVTSSRVTSANTTAASIKNNVDTFLTNADTAGYGMKLSDSALATLTLTIDDKGEWGVTVGDDTAFKSSTSKGTGAFKTGGSKTWLGSGTSVGKSKATTTCAEDILALELKALFPEVKNSVAQVYLKGGKALYCWYTADAAALDKVSDAPTATEFSKEVCEWDTKTAGVSADGYIMGTAPALALGNAS